ncbi:hypothetical protein H2198_003934 [Neophaeococcomyces mojaviensis]|uniref:Uncharacterized protein n=1 Tax=Neophaeococcomyces mojaviensis TaxID=3383035 RepID=A0ACC3AAF0_9EURO|nr:hypothetical protein H2198_003934 [Knufia sp. JES_112]
MTPPAETNGNLPPESKEVAESLIPLFQFTKILNQDQGGRRVLILGTLNGQQGILSLERAAFPSSQDKITSFLSTLTNTTNLGANDIYRWYLSNNSSFESPDLKINLIWPCTEAHIRKYKVQQTRYVTETSEVYKQHIKPWVEQTQRTAQRLDWIYNILDGRTEQDDIVYRSAGFGRYNKDDKSDSEGFLLLPDLNWDRRTVTGLHLLAIIERRDLWSLRGLKRSHVPWLKQMRAEIVKAAAEVGTKLVQQQAPEANGGTPNAFDGGTGTEMVDEDQIKCYVHYQPTYYHFHVHVVHVMLEAEGSTQSVGKAFSLENLISQLEHMVGDNAGMDQVDLSYFMGEQSDLWKKCFSKLKSGEKVDLNDE